MTKLKKKGLSEKFVKKSAKKRTINPFEVHVNRQKFDVLGRKSKNDRGLPGVARSKSIKKRKETLLQEYKVKDKTNRFLDRRIGEHNNAMTQEDRIMARYTAERVKAHNKKAMFNLADDEILTHRGQTLSEIEKFDDPRSDEEDDVFEREGKGKGGLEASFVGDAHFGGGIFKDKEEGVKSRASLIEELIAESKKRKAERQRSKEKTLELTEKLDADWHELLPLVDSGKAVVEDEDERLKKASYDQLMKELKFESRGTPSDKLKSEDEVAKEEKQKLEKLEEERIRRMKGVDPVSEKTTGAKHRSADDLDDGFDIQSDIEDDKNMEESTAIERGDSESDDDDDDDEIEENDDDDDAESENSKPEKLDDTKVNIEGNNADDDGEGNDNNGNNEDDFESGSDDDGDDLSDLKGSSDDDDEAGDGHKNSMKTEVEIKEDCDTKTNIEKLDTEKFKEDLLKKKQKMEEARKELPYTFKMPENYEEFQSLMKDYGPDHQGVIVERIIKCYHPSLGADNKVKLESLFTFLLQHLNDTEYDACWKVLDRLAPHLFDITQFSPTNSAHCLMEVLAEKQNDFREKGNIFPDTDTLVFLKLIPLLFPASDHRHQIVTPAVVFLTQMLNQCKLFGKKAIATGLFIATMLLECSALSRRYCPEVVKFLKGILQMAISEEAVTLPNCKSVYHPLVMETFCGDVKEEETRLSFLDMCPKTKQIDKDFQVRSIYTTLGLLEIAINQYENEPAFSIVFSSIRELLQKLHISKYPTAVKDFASKLTTMLNSMNNRKMEYVMLEKKRPKALRLYEPEIEKVIDGRKRRMVTSEEQAEHQKLVAKYKREMKGALREIRRDRSFLSKIKFRQQAKSDEERIRKVKQIYGWGAEQQGEFNKLKRKKK